METTVTPIKRTRLYMSIAEVLAEYGELTAHEVAKILYTNGVVAYPVRDSVQPRITEMCKLGRVVVCGSKVDKETKKRVSTYRLSEKE